MRRCLGGNNEGTFLILLSLNVGGILPYENTLSFMLTWLSNCMVWRHSEMMCKAHIKRHRTLLLAATAHGVPYLREFPKSRTRRYMICAKILGEQAISSNSLLDVGNSHDTIHGNFWKYSACLRKSGEIKGKGLIGIGKYSIFGCFPL